MLNILSSSAAAAVAWYVVCSPWLDSGLLLATLGFPDGSEGKESTCNAGDLGSIPGLGRSPRGGHGNPLQYSCLENPMDRGIWWATVRGHKESDMTEWPSTAQHRPLSLCCPWLVHKTFVKQRLFPDTLSLKKSRESCAKWEERSPCCVAGRNENVSWCFTIE